MIYMIVPMPHYCDNAAILQQMASEGEEILLNHLQQSIDKKGWNLVVRGGCSSECFGD